MLNLLTKYVSVSIISFVGLGGYTLTIMKIDISAIRKNASADMPVTFNDMLEGLDTVTEPFVFTQPIAFTGSLVNNEGVLKLTGFLKAHYVSSCYRCLNKVDGELTIEVDESFIEKSVTASTDEEAYTYENYCIFLDDVLKDNIVLHLPMMQVCNPDCKGLCQTCGSDLNSGQCNCTSDTINPQFETLKNFFNN